MIGLIFLMFGLFCCKKKTSIEAKVYNYALAEPVANAKVVLVERKENGLFVSEAFCTEIASATTDSEGNCSFSKEKLKTGAKYTYYLAVAEAYGKPQDYPCGGKTSGFLNVGETIKETLEVGSIPAYFRVQINNLFNLAIIGDSLIVNIHNPKYTLPGSQYPKGGGGVYSGGGIFNGTIPSSVILDEIKNTNAGKNTIHLRKRKMGIVTTSIDTVKIYPYETKTIEINW